MTDTKTTQTTYQAGPIVPDHGWVLFSIDREADEAAREAFTRSLRSFGVYPVPFLGCYKGQKEHAWHVNAPSWNRIVRKLSDVAGQESVLFVDDETHASALIFFDGSEPVEIGVWTRIDAEAAERLDGWSQDPATGEFFSAI